MELLVGVPDQQSASVIQIDGKTAQADHPIELPLSDPASGNAAANAQ